MIFRKIIVLSILLGINSSASACWFFCSSSSDYTKTRYPIVLVTGITGSPTAIGPIPTEYFYGIEDALEDDGAHVYVAPISPVNSDYVRGEQLNDFVDLVMAREGTNKVNLIGHSQGGLTSRYLASTQPNKVASITSFGTPNQDSDLIKFIAQKGIVEIINLGLLQALGDMSSLIYGAPMDSDSAATIAYARSMDQFNQVFSEGLPSNKCGEGASIVNGIRYYSLSGNALYTTAYDPTDTLLAITSLVAGDDSDGLVGRCESHLGKVIRDDYFMNHVDEVNGLYGMVNWFSTNPKTVYRSHANRLKNIGL